MLVGVKHQIAFATIYCNRHDLVLEVACFYGALGAVVAFNRQSVLVFPADAPLCCNVFSCDAHVDLVKRVVQGA